MSIRPRFQRAFLAWLEEARPRLALQPRLIRRTDETLVLRFDGLRPDIEAEIERDPRGSSVSIFVQPAFAVGGPSILLYLDTDVVAAPGGYVFPDDTSPDAPVFQDRASAWQHLLFEPFLKWINGKLAKADSVALLWADEAILGDPDRILRSHYLRLVSDDGSLPGDLSGYTIGELAPIRSGTADGRGPAKARGLPPPGKLPRHLFRKNRP